MNKQSELLGMCAMDLEGGEADLVVARGKFERVLLAGRSGYADSYVDFEWEVRDQDDDDETRTQLKPKSRFHTSA
jgi:hypothetical protein